MLQLWDLVNQLITCIIMLLSINGQEFVVMASKESEAPVSTLKAHSVTHREFQTYSNAMPSFTTLRSESDKVFSTTESERQNNHKSFHEESYILRPRISEPATEAERIIRYPISGSATFLFRDNRRLQESKNNASAVSDRLIIENSINTSELLRNELLENNKTIDKNTSKLSCSGHICEKLQKESDRLTAHKPAIPKIPVLPTIFNNPSAHKEKNNDLLEVPNETVFENSSDITSNESFKNNRTVNNVISSKTKNVTVDDRASFDADKCPTGYVKIQGKCVPQH